jgi:hypothetical protein
VGSFDLEDLEKYNLVSKECDSFSVYRLLEVAGVF